MNGLWVAEAESWKWRRGFGAGISGFPFECLGALDKLHLHRDLYLEDIDQVLFLAELSHGTGDDIRLLLGVLDRLLAVAVDVVADEFQEEGDVVGAAFIPDALDESVLAIIDVAGLERGCNRAEPSRSQRRLL